LPPDRSEAVEAWLANHPEDAGRVAAWRAQAEAIRARYGATIHGPVPDRLTLSQITRSQRPGFDAAAAAVVAFVMAASPADGARCVSGGANAVALFTRTRSRRTSFTSVRCAIRSRSAVISIAVVAARRNDARFDRRFARSFAPPAARHQRPAALFMYEGVSGERFTIYCSRPTAREPRSAMTTTTASAQCTDEAYGWVVSGPKDKDKLKAVASSAYDQLREPHAGAVAGAAGRPGSRRGS
jgi:anti-sigma factor RsiW